VFLSLNFRGSIQGVKTWEEFCDSENWTSRLGAINSRWSWLCYQADEKILLIEWEHFMIGVTGQVKLTNVLF
jgi:hypothetical protein